MKKLGSIAALQWIVLHVNFCVDSTHAFKNPTRRYAHKQYHYRRRTSNFNDIHLQRKHRPNHSHSASRSTPPLHAATSSWEHGPSVTSKPYLSRLLMSTPSLQLQLLEKLEELDQDDLFDPLWEQIKLEAQYTLQNEPGSGPQLYTNIISQPSLLHAITSIVSHEISTQLIPATSLQNLFLEMFNPVEDNKAVSLDVMASAMRSPSIVDGTAMNSVLFNQGLHALVCHRLAHRLWESDRTGLAYYIQSTVSSQYSTDIHPAATFGSGVYLNAGSAGVVIGETAVVDHDVIIMQGVTLGGTGKERGDRHPKVKKNTILEQSCSVLGNIEIGEGSIIGAKSIVTKPVASYTKVSGVPAKYVGDVEKYKPESMDSNEEGGTGESVSDEVTSKNVQKIQDLLKKHSVTLLNERKEGNFDGHQLT